MNLKELEVEPMIADMNPFDFSYSAVHWAVINGICSLDSAHRFRPADPVSRLDIIVCLWRMSGMPKHEGESYGIMDIPADSEYLNAVQWGLEKRIMFLDKYGNFYPARNCSRRDVVAYLYRRAGYPHTPLRDYVVLDYDDKNFLGNVIWAVDKGIVILDEGRFYPYELISRSTMAGYLYRSVENRRKK